MIGAQIPLVGYYDYRLVALSVFIAILAAYAALDLAGRVTSACGFARFFWLSGGAIAMGTGIWSMHYIGMEALVLPVPVLYDWPTVLVSMLAAIVAAGIALFVVSRKTLGVSAVVIGSITMGSGIAAMHYIGMEAMRLPAMCHYSRNLVSLSVALAIVISGVALFLTYRFRGETTNVGWWKVICAVTMGAAIPVMHYVGMAAATFIPMPLAEVSLRHAVKISALGISAITLVTLVMLGLVYVLSTVDRRFTLQAIELRSGEKRYRQIVETAFDAFVGFDASLLIEHWNPQAERTFGWTRSEAKGLSLNQCIELDRNIDGLDKSLRGLLEESGTGEMQKRIEILARHKDGHEFPAEMAISSIRSGATLKFAAFVHDVTERKQVEREREAAKKAAEAASRAKGDFLANMSHEIRTPLNGVIGMTELVLQTELTREQKEYLETVRFSAESLLSVINDILDFSKIEAGKVELESIDFDIRECLETTLRTMALRADEKGLELLCDVDSTVPEVLRGDPNRLRQIVVNLVGNAIKFTHEGEVTVKVGTSAHNDNKYRLDFVVSDTGIGIAAEKLESIFNSFSQADTSTTREYGGTGLGLTISRRLVEMMGGCIRVESEIGKGSAFRFTIELECGRAPVIARTESSQHGVLEGTRVLVVDDNRTNRRILGGLLTSWGMEPELVADGQSALLAVRVASDAGRPYHLIVTDMHMPKMDGFELVEHLQDGDRSIMPTIMMLTSGRNYGDAARCEQLGVAAYLMKPIRQAELREAVARVLGAMAENRQTHIVTNTTLAHNRNTKAALSVLLAEDNEVNQRLAKRLLEKRGHSVVVVKNGREALEAVREGKYDLVLMDVQMPEMDGITATAALRDIEKQKGEHLPVIAMTALVMKGDRERCLAAGMDGYLPKPIRSHELDEVLEKYSAQRSSSAESFTSTESTISAMMPSAVDPHELLERIGEDREVLAELVAAFREDFPKQVDLVTAALKKRDTKELTSAAHSLKGALSNLAAQRASALAATIESAGKLGDFTGAEIILPDLECELARVVAALNVLCEETVQ